MRAVHRTVPPVCFLGPPKLGDRPPKLGDRVARVVHELDSSSEDRGRD